MADQNQNFNTEDVEADARAEQEARVAAEAKRKADEAAAEAAKQSEIEDSIVEDEASDVVYASVVLDPEYADECDCDVATVGTANGEYVLSSTPTPVPQTDLENVLTSPAAKEQN